MFNISEKANQNYLAKIVRLSNIRKHPNADRLQVTTIDGNDVITGTDAKEGDAVVYFPLECAINKDFLAATNSFEDKELNADKSKKGFFNSKGRVRAVKLRGNPSMGYIVPVEVLFNWINSVTASSTYIYSTAYDNKEFDSFTSGDKEIIVCKKYINVQQILDKKKERKEDRKKAAKKQSKLVDNQFRLHCDTPQLGRNLFKFGPEDVIAITHKLHGTSGVFSNILCHKKLTWYQKLLKKLGADVNTQQYDFVYSSRKVIKNQYYNDEKVNPGYYGEDAWGVVAKEYEPFLQQGMTIYSEIVGFLQSGRAIQKDYDYGCAEGQHEKYVYRITTTTPNGQVIEWPTLQVQEWCKSKGLKAVPLYFYGKAKDLFPELDTTTHWNDNFFEKLKETYLEKKDPICKNDVPDEGVCIRREGLEIDTYKLKSFAFLQRESEELDTGTTDIESEESVEQVETQS